MSEPPSGTGRVLAPPSRTAVKPLGSPPRFSVVIPAYQAAETIGEAVRSALDQVHPAHEVIVVDDGSKDDLAGALRPYQERITLLRKQNGGAASARNEGAAAATGDFFSVLDADDTYHPRRLESLADLACARPDLDLVTTDTRFVVNGRVTGTFAGANPFEIENQRTAILQSCFVGGWPAMRLDRVRSIDGFDETLRISHDWDCALRLILGGSLAGLVDRPYYDYRLHPGSLTASRVEGLWDRVALLEKARVNPDLQPEERAVLMDSLRWNRTRAVMAEARAALYESGPRERLLGMSVSRNLEPRARLAAASAWAAPPLARRLVGRA